MISCEHAYNLVSSPKVSQCTRKKDTHRITYALNVRPRSKNDFRKILDAPYRDKKTISTTTTNDESNGKS